MMLYSTSILGKYAIRRLPATCFACHRNMVSHSYGRSERHHRLSLRTLSKNQLVITSSWMSIVHRPLSSTSGGDADLLTNESGVSDSLISGYIPPPPAAADVSTVADQLTSLGEPTLSSLGLAGYYPTGWVQSLLEYIHVTTDIPWFGSIIILTVLIRTLSLPLTVIQLRNAANMSNHMPIMQRIQAQQKEAMKLGDWTKVEKLSAELSAYNNRNDCSPLKMLYRPLMAAPIFLSVFWGIKGMTNLPVQSLVTGGGSLWFTDLTIADPYFILPFLSAFTVFLVTKTGSEGASLEAMPPHLRTFLTVLPVGIFAFIAFQPSALALYWTVSNSLSLIFGKAFRTAYMKNIFNIPDMITHNEDAFPKSKSNDSFKDSAAFYQKLAQLNQEMEDRRRVGALQFNQRKVQSDQKKKHIITLNPNSRSNGMYENSNESEFTDEAQPSKQTEANTSKYDPAKPRLSRTEFMENPINTGDSNERK